MTSKSTDNNPVPFKNFPSKDLLFPSDKTALIATEAANIFFSTLLFYNAFCQLGPLFRPRQAQTGTDIDKYIFVVNYGVFDCDIGYHVTVMAESRCFNTVLDSSGAGCRLMIYFVASEFV